MPGVRSSRFIASRPDQPVAATRFVDVQSTSPRTISVCRYGLPPACAAISRRRRRLAPTRGCLNIHASLLPRWRGAAPIQAAILAGDTQTGITIMQMEAGLDTGPMLLRQGVPITEETTTATLHDILASLGARMILEALAARPAATSQNDHEATYAPKLAREDGRIVWSRPAENIDRQIRAFDPWPGTFTILAGEPLKILAAHRADGCSIPGTVLDSRLTVACGDHAIRLTRVQLPGRAALDADAFLRGHPVPPGTMLGQ